MFDDNDNLINAFQLMNKETLITYNDDIELIFIELKKFTKTQQRNTSLRCLMMSTKLRSTVKQLYYIHIK